MGGSKWGALFFMNILLSSVLPTTAVQVVHGIDAGVNKETGERPARKDLSDFEFSGPAFDLYILALQQFQDQDNREDLLGYWKVVGIHGYPYVSWDGVEGPGGAGYCTHESVLFPTWHRPYLALYEENLWKHAQDIATKFPEDKRQQYIDAAKTFRMPYWDWANDPKMPKSLTTPEINVQTPEGLKSIRNPLYSYTINPTPQAGFPAKDQLIQYPASVRNPDDNGNTNIDAVQKALTSNGAYLRINTYQVLSNSDNFTVISTASLKDQPANYNNLDVIHGLIHVSVGGKKGHMTEIPWSSYDPIFWLHHTNVDRVIALWQTLHPDSWVEPLPNAGGDYVRPAGTLEDINTPLTPFHISDKDFYTSASARSTRQFGYTYPEIEDWGVDQDTLARNVRSKVNALYNRPSDHNGSKKRHADLHHGLKHRTLSDLPVVDDLEDLLHGNFSLADFFEDLGTTSLLDFTKWGINNMKKQWVVNLRVNKMARPGPFRVFFFMGDAPQDSNSWAYAHNLVGTYATFKSSMPMANDDQPHWINAQIPLSHAFASMFASKLLSNFEDDTILPILKRHMDWRVQDIDGCVVDGGEMTGKNGGAPGLEIEIARRDMQPLADDDSIRDTFPTALGDWKIFKDVAKC